MAYYSTGQGCSCLRTQALGALGFSRPEAFAPFFTAYMEVEGCIVPAAHFKTEKYDNKPQYKLFFLEDIIALSLSSLRVLVKKKMAS